MQIFLSWRYEHPSKFGALWCGSGSSGYQDTWNKVDTFCGASACSLLAKLLGPKIINICDVLGQIVVAADQKDIFVDNLTLLYAAIYKKRVDLVIKTLEAIDPSMLNLLPWCNFEVQTWWQYLLANALPIDSLKQAAKTMKGPNRIALEQALGKGR